MTFKRGFILLAVALLIGAVTFIPARMLESPLNARLAQFGSLSEARGTIWSGTGVLNLGTAKAQARVPITWRLTPASLLRLRLGFDVLAKSDTINGTARAGIGAATLALSDIDVSVDATLVSAFNDLAAFAGPRGLLRLKTGGGDSISMGYGAPLAITGKLNARAENFAARTIFPKPIGTYEINIIFRESVAEYAFADASGLLKFDGGGQVQWAPRREFVYNGVAAPSREAPLLLAALLPFGRPTLDGKVRIDYKTGW